MGGATSVVRVTTIGMQSCNARGDNRAGLKDSALALTHLRMASHRLSTAFTLFAVLSRPLVAQAPQLSVAPAHPNRGSIVRVILTQPTLRGDSIVSIDGSMASEPLHFTSAGPGIWHSIGGIPVDAPLSLAAQAVIKYTPGNT